MPWCGSYQKGSLLVALNYGRQLYLLRFILIEKMFHQHILNKKDETNIDELWTCDNQNTMTWY